MPRKSTRRQRKGGNGWLSGITGMLTGSNGASGSTVAQVSSSGAPACMNGSTQLQDAQGNPLFGYPDTQAMVPDATDPTGGVPGMMPGGVPGMMPGQSYYDGTGGYRRRSRRRRSRRSRRGGGFSM